MSVNRFNIEAYVEDALSILVEDAIDFSPEYEYVEDACDQNFRLAVAALTELLSEGKETFTEREFPPSASGMDEADDRLQFLLSILAVEIENEADHMGDTLYRIDLSRKALA